jgi:Ca2+-binding EF-hand superfamily protein
MTLRKRIPNHREGAKRGDFFAPETFAELRRAFNVHFKIETMAEDVRRRLQSSPNFNVFEAFSIIDPTKLGAIGVG